MNVSGVACFFTALKYIPFADATAMLLFGPVVATVLSPFFLNEKIGPLRIAAAVFGFLGVIIILRPGFAGESIGYYFGFGAGVLIGLYFISNRLLAGSEDFLLNITFNGLTGALALTPLVIWVWEPIPESTYMELAIIVAMSVIGQGSMISSFNFGPAALISPYSYTMIIFATLIGYFVFGTLPDAFSWTGMTLIVGSGLFIAHREQMQRKAAT